MKRFLLAWLALLPLVATASADDWPQWMGPSRNGVYRETGIHTTIPETGLPIRWRRPLAGGYAGPAVAGGRVYVMDYVRESGDAVNNPGVRATLDGQERVLCLDAKTGDAIWQHSYDRPYQISYPAGPRCTPTIAAGKVYALGAEGDLLVLDAEDGEVLWQRNVATDFNAEVPIWGFAGHPLVANGMVITMVGGENQAVVAFDADSGEVRWQALSAAHAGYCPPSIIDVDGKKQLIVWTITEIASLDPETGEVYWTLDLEPQYGMAIARPQIESDLLYASGIGNQSVLARLQSDPPGVEELWRGEVRRSLYAGNSTPLIVDGVIYGSDSQLGSFIAVDTKDGTRLWETFQPTTGGERRAGHGTAFTTYHEPSGQFFLMSETGDLITATLTREAYEETGRFHVLEPTGEAFGRSVLWSHPAYADRTVFVRNDKEIVAVDLSR